MKTTLQGGWGYWRTDRYPIGGEFHRTVASLPVELTGKEIEFGAYTGYLEFKVEAGVQGGKAWTGAAKPEAFEVHHAS